MKLSKLKDILTPPFPMFVPCSVWENGKTLHEGGSVQWTIKEYGDREVERAYPFIKDGEAWLALDLKPVEG